MELRHSTVWFQFTIICFSLQVLCFSGFLVIYLTCYNHEHLTEFFTILFGRLSSQFCIVRPTPFAIILFLAYLIPSFNYSRSYSVVAPGNTVNIIGEFDEGGSCDINHDNNFLIVHPDILVSGTRVVILYSLIQITYFQMLLQSCQHIFVLRVISYSFRL